MSQPRQGRGPPRDSDDDGDDAGDGPSTSSGLSRALAQAGPSQEEDAMEEGCEEPRPGPSSQAPRRPAKRTEAQVQQKVNELVQFLLVKDQKKVPIRRADMVKTVLQDYKDLASAIIERAGRTLEEVFGLQLREIDAKHHAYIIVNKLERLEGDGMRQDQGVAKMGLLMVILSLIFMKGNAAREALVWDVLRKLRVDPDKRHKTFGDVKKLVKDEFVRQKYLEYTRVPHTDPPEYEFLWGPRAAHETSKMQVLRFVAKIQNREPSSWASQYSEALQDEMASAAAAGPASSATYWPETLHTKSDRPVLDTRQRSILIRATEALVPMVTEPMRAGSETEAREAGPGGAAARRRCSRETPRESLARGRPGAGPRAPSASVPPGRRPAPSSPHAERRGAHVPHAAQARRQPGGGAPRGAEPRHARGPRARLSRGGRGRAEGPAAGPRPEPGVAMSQPRQGRGPPRDSDDDGDDAGDGPSTSSGLSRALAQAGPSQEEDAMEEGCEEPRPGPSSQAPRRPAKRTEAQVQQKVNELVQFLLVKDQKKVPIRRADMVKTVLQDYKDLASAIIERAGRTLEEVFGLQLREIDAKHHAYIIVNKLERLEGDGMRQDQGVAKMGLLMVILSLIFMKGNAAREALVWDVLRKLRVDPDKRHKTFGDVKKLVKDEFVRQKYLEYTRVPHTDPPEYEFLWGPRAAHETSKMQVLRFVAKIQNREPSSWASQYSEALQDEMASAAAAGPASSAT
ncbi:melanoma-associated antigen E1-like [Macrotis lagotis]|uniref:melanoma-associated antigen E1-like n=1 Tax=Macrotis lagotis TaxID=92651 RepID=UPI003D693DA2